MDINNSQILGGGKVCYYQVDMLKGDLSTQIHLSI